MFRQGYQLDLDELTQEEIIAMHNKVLEQDEWKNMTGDEWISESDISELEWSTGTRIETTKSRQEDILMRARHFGQGQPQDRGGD
jgi:hypothetical protein